MNEIGCGIRTEKTEQLEQNDSPQNKELKIIAKRYNIKQTCLT